mgnify:CR=1 FL=1
MEQKIIEIIAEYQDRDESEYTADQTFTEMGLAPSVAVVIMMAREFLKHCDYDFNREA